MTPKSFNKAMGAVIRQQRKLHGLTQEQVGKALGVSYQQITKNECGINGFAAHYLPIVAEMFGVTVAFLYEQAGVRQEKGSDPTEAENDSFLVARYVARIADSKLRSHIVDFTRKCAYQGAEA